MVLKLISSTPSPYARKVRIQLLEKGIPFELKTEVPWDHTTETPQYNPLEKLPVLIFDTDDPSDNNNGHAPIYDSSYIVAYMEEMFEPKGSLTPLDTKDRFRARQIEVLADGVCDAWILQIFEQRRGEKMSAEWDQRQARKVEGGVRELAKLVEEGKGDFLIGEKLSIADLAVVSMVDFLRMRQHPLMAKYHGLCEYADKLNQRDSFKQTKPYPFEIKDKIV